jgi:hypothetical protein
MKRPLIERKDFQPSIRQGEQAQGGVIGNLPRGVVSCVCFLEEKGENEFVRNFLFLCVEKCYSWEKMCANKNHERKLCVPSSCSRVHERISMTKPLDS